MEGTSDIYFIFLYCIMNTNRYILKRQRSSNLPQKDYMLLGLYILIKMIFRITQLEEKCILTEILALRDENASCTPPEAQRRLRCFPCSVIFHQCTSLKWIIFFYDSGFQFCILSLLSFFSLPIEKRFPFVKLYPPLPTPQLCLPSSIWWQRLSLERLPPGLGLGK